MTVFFSKKNQIKVTESEKKLAVEKNTYLFSFDRETLAMVREKICFGKGFSEFMTPDNDELAKPVFSSGLWLDLRRGLRINHVNLSKELILFQTLEEKYPSSSENTDENQKKLKEKIVDVFRCLEIEMTVELFDQLIQAYCQTPLGYLIALINAKLNQDNSNAPLMIVTDKTAIPRIANILIPDKEAEQKIILSVKSAIAIIPENEASIESLINNKGFPVEMTLSLQKKVKIKIDEKIDEKIDDEEEIGYGFQIEKIETSSKEIADFFQVKSSFAKHLEEMSSKFVKAAEEKIRKCKCCAQFKKSALGYKIMALDALIYVYDNKIKGKLICDYTPQEILEAWLEDFFERATAGQDKDDDFSFVKKYDLFQMIAMPRGISFLPSKSKTEVLFENVFGEKIWQEAKERSKKENKTIFDVSPALSMS